MSSATRAIEVAPGVFVVDVESITAVVDVTAEPRTSAPNPKKRSAIHFGARIMVVDASAADVAAKLWPAGEEGDLVAKYNDYLQAVLLVLERLSIGPHERGANEAAAKVLRHHGMKSGKL